MGNFMKTIDVSFVIPVYNDSNYIDKCIECINNQGLDSFEIIFVDDCSTDNSVEIININNELAEASTVISYSLVDLCKTDQYYR